MTERAEGWPPNVIPIAICANINLAKSLGLKSRLRSRRSDFRKVFKSRGRGARKLIDRSYAPTNCPNLTAPIKYDNEGICRESHMVSQRERTAIFLERLASAPASASEAEALTMLARTLAGVEDEFTTIPNDPSQWKTDGRLYPPQTDNRFAVQGHNDIVRFRNRKHSTLIGSNGAIKIMKEGVTCLDKPGADGWTITSLMARTVSSL
jgi:hypothetical protein